MRYLRLRSLASDMAIVIGPVDDVSAARLYTSEAPFDELLTAVLERDGALRVEHYASEPVEL